jgi:hypothetical protein
VRDEFGPEPQDGEPAGKPGSDEARARYAVDAADGFDAGAAAERSGAVLFPGCSGAVPASRQGEPEGSAFAPPSGVVLPDSAADGAPTWLPGAATYFGLLGLTRHHLAQGFTSLSTAVALALAIAVGVNLGNEIARLVLPVPGMATGRTGRRAAKRTRGF